MSPKAEKGGYMRCGKEIPYQAYQDCSKVSEHKERMKLAEPCVPDCGMWYYNSLERCLPCRAWMIMCHQQKIKNNDEYDMTVAVNKCYLE
jgi:hypothetical protein